MRFRLFYFIVSFFIAFTTSAQTNIKTILILGDSYLKGNFGEFLQKKMHEAGKYDILSVAIGGAGSKTFLPPMKNLCCGYRVRQTCAGDTLVKTKKATGVKVPVLESAEIPTKGIVMKLYSGNILWVMKDWKPDAVILVLGENYLNAHEELLKIIKSYNADIPIVWVGPFDKSNSVGRYKLIEKAINNMPGCFLVKSDSIVSKLGIVPTHFKGTPAKKIAEAVFKQFEPFLDTTITVANKK